MYFKALLKWTEISKFIPHLCLNKIISNRIVYKDLLIFLLTLANYDFSLYFLCMVNVLKTSCHTSDVYVVCTACHLTMLQYQFLHSFDIFWQRSGFWTTLTKLILLIANSLTHVASHSKLWHENVRNLIKFV